MLMNLGISMYRLHELQSKSGLSLSASLLLMRDEDNNRSSNINVIMLLVMRHEYGQNFRLLPANIVKLQRRVKL